MVSTAKSGDGMMGAQNNVPFSIETWLTRDIEPLDHLLGDIFSTTTRGLLVGPTGLGKTNFALGMACSMAAGISFLHWKARRPAKILYIDGELSRQWMQTLLNDAMRRMGADAEKVKKQMFIMSREDHEEMSSLSTSAGQEVIDKAIEDIGGVDFVFFDNIQALLVGDMREEEPWSNTLPWIRNLTRRKIGQLWIHHTGHDERKSYGTKTREWQVDLVMHMERLNIRTKTIAFKLKFTKARTRTPENLNQFDRYAFELADDRWTSRATATKSEVGPSPLGKKFHAALHKALRTDRTELIHSSDGVTKAVTLKSWKAQCVKEALIKKENIGDTDQNRKQNTLFHKYKRELLECRWVVIDDDHIWPSK
jgi:hypothetical protein